MLGGVLGLGAGTAREVRVEVQPGPVAGDARTRRHRASSRAGCGDRPGALQIEPRRMEGRCPSTCVSGSGSNGCQAEWARRTQAVREGPRPVAVAPSAPARARARTARGARAASPGPAMSMPGAGPRRGRAARAAERSRPVAAAECVGPTLACSGAGGPGLAAPFVCWRAATTRARARGDPTCTRPAQTVRVAGEAGPERPCASCRPGERFRRRGGRGGRGRRRRREAPRIPGPLLG